MGDLRCSVDVEMDGLPPQARFGFFFLFFVFCFLFFVFCFLFFVLVVDCFFFFFFCLCVLDLLSVLPLDRSFCGFIMPFTENPSK